MPVALPWWQEVEPVVRAARELHGIDVTILRLLDAERDRPHGGAVTYLAEVAASLCRPNPGTGGSTGTRCGSPTPSRAGRRPTSPGRDPCSTGTVIALAGAPVQVRSWNLSSVWRIPVSGQTVWLKVVPPFFAHEGRVLAALGGRARAASCSDMMAAASCSPRSPARTCTRRRCHDCSTW